METTTGDTLSSVIARLKASPASYDFFGAVRLLNAHLPAHAPATGTSLRLADDPIRFAQRPMMELPLTRLLEIEDQPEPRPADRAAAAKVWISFFGLFGTNGPFPYHLTALAAADPSGSAATRRSGTKPGGALPGRVGLRDSENSFSAFCNLFHHRLISLYYRAWAVNQKVVALDEWARSSVRGGDPNSAAPRGLACFADLTGIPDEELGGASDSTSSSRLRSVRSLHQFFFAGWLASPVRSAEGLGTILSAYFGLPIQIEEHRGAWLPLPEEARCVLSEGRANQLGVDTILGASNWDVQLSFRVKLGPLKNKDFQSFLPGQTRFDRLQDWVETYCAYEYFWDVQLIHDRYEVPEVTLGGTTTLGWTSWIKSAAPAVRGSTFVSVADLKEFSGLSSFSITDLRKGPWLVTRLKNSADPVSEFVRSRLRPSTKRDLEAWPASASPPEALQEGLVDDLNAILKGEAIWDEARFASVELRGDTRALLLSRPGGGELVRLHRLLLEDAYPREILRNQASSLIAKLKSPQDGVSLFIRDRLGDATLTLLSDWKPPLPPSAKLQQEIVRELNAILAGDLIWEETRFQGVKFRSKTRELMSLKPSGDRLVHLNRLLLEDAYRLELARTPVPTDPTDVVLIPEVLRQRERAEALRSTQAATSQP